MEVRADDAGDPGLPGALIATYRYNGLNHRVQKILWDDADPQTPDTTIDYYYNAGWQVVEERVDDDVHAQYLWCLSYIDTPVLRWRDTTGNEQLDETLYYTVDANKNVTALIDAATGNVVERYLYDPYGRVMVLDDGWNSIAWSASKKNEILFTGYRWNPETGYYQARHREYHPLLGRFLQRDPLGHVDGGNLYAGYFAMWGGVDPMGLTSHDPDWAWHEIHVRGYYKPCIVCHGRDSFGVVWGPTNMHFIPDTKFRTPPWDTLWEPEACVDWELYAACLRGVRREWSECRENVEFAWREATDRIDREHAEQRQRCIRELQPGWWLEYCLHAADLAHGSARHYAFAVYTVGCLTCYSRDYMAGEEACWSGASYRAHRCKDGQRASDGKRRRLP